MKNLLSVLVLGLLLVPATSLAAFDVDLRYGSSGAEVFELQEFLTAQGVYSGPITGNFYSLTLAAVKAFQSREGVSPVSGYFGPLTRAEANSLLSVELAESDKEASTTPPVVTSDKPKTTKTTTTNTDSSQDSDTSSGGGTGGTAPAEPPSVVFDVKFKDGVSEDAPEGEIRRDFYVSVTGEWDKAQVKIVGPDDVSLVSLGMNPPSCEFRSKRGCDGRMGHFVAPNTVPLGEYRWEVKARRGNQEITETGTFRVE